MAIDILTKDEIQGLLNAIDHPVVLKTKEMITQINANEAAITANQSALGDGGALPYVAGVPVDWAGAPPATVGEALDRIGTAVAGLLGVPIP